MVHVWQFPSWWPYFPDWFTVGRRNKKTEWTTWNGHQLYVVCACAHERSTGSSPVKPSIPLGHHLVLLCSSPSPPLSVASRPTPLRWWSRPRRLSCRSRGTAAWPRCPAGGGSPSCLDERNKWGAQKKWIHEFETPCDTDEANWGNFLSPASYFVGTVHLPGFPEKRPSPSSTSTVRHNGEASLDSTHRTAVSMSAEGKPS